MSLITINKNPSPRELRWFGLAPVVFGAIVSGILYAKSGWPLGSWVPLAAGALLAAVYYAIPALRRSIYLGWMYAFLPLGMAMSFLLLAGIFFLVFAPIAFLMRLVGRERVPRGFNRTATTYWIKRPAARPPESYFRQF
jgi:hypothetical protein